MSKIIVECCICGTDYVSGQAGACPYCTIETLEQQLQQLQQAHRDATAQLAEANNKLVVYERAAECDRENMFKAGILRAAEALCKNCEAEGLNIRCDLCTDIAAIYKEAEHDR